MTDLSPMERAVLALAAECWEEPSEAQLRTTAIVMTGMKLLRTRNPEAFDAVLAEFAMDGKSLGTRTADVLRNQGYHLVSEGQAVIEGRVVELERFGSWDPDAKDGQPPLLEYAHKWAEPLYRVKPERSDRHTEDAS